MPKSIRKATFIVRLWKDGGMLDEDAWRGTAEHIGSGHSGKFETLNEFIEWLRQQLAKIEGKSES
jgi:hypothetical protein